MHLITEGTMLYESISFQQPTGNAMQMARTQSWIEAVQNYHNGCPSGAVRPPREMELHAKPVHGNQISHYQNDSTYFNPKKHLPDLQTNPFTLPDFVTEIMKHRTLSNYREVADKPQKASSFYSSPVAQFTVDSLRNKILPPTICKKESDMQTSTMSPLIGDRGKEYASSPPTSRWEREYENDGDDEEDLNSEPDLNVKRRKCEKREVTPVDLCTENSSGKLVSQEETMDMTDCKT